MLFFSRLYLGGALEPHENRWCSRRSVFSPAVDFLGSGSFFMYLSLVLVLFRRDVAADIRGGRAVLLQCSCSWLFRVFNTVPSQFTPRLLPVLQAVWKLEDPAVLARERQQREQEQVRMNDLFPIYVLPCLRLVPVADPRMGRSCVWCKALHFIFLHFLGFYTKLPHQVWPDSLSACL